MAVPSGVLPVVACYVAITWVHIQAVQWTLEESIRRSVNRLPVLPDILHDKLPSYPQWVLFPDAGLLAWVAATICALWVREEPAWPVLCHLTVAHTVVVGMRALCVSVTILPTPVMLYRHPESVPDSRAVRWYMSVILTPNDLMFSGHAALYMLLACVWTTYIVDTWAYCAVAWVVGLLLSVSLVVTRQHYTSDIVVAVFLVVQTFHADWVEGIVLHVLGIRE